jgi:hypothetical protein
MGRNVHGAKCQWGESCMGRNVPGRVVHGPSCPWGKLSMGRSVHGASCPWGEMSLGWIIHGASCLWGELSMGRNDWGQMPWGELSVGPVSMGRVVRESIRHGEVDLNSFSSDIFSNLNVNSTVREWFPSKGYVLLLKCDDDDYAGQPWLLGVLGTSKYT